MTVEIACLNFNGQNTFLIMNIITDKLMNNHIHVNAIGLHFSHNHYIFVIVLLADQIVRGLNTIIVILTKMKGGIS
jgi:hypothetical protein